MSKNTGEGMLTGWRARLKQVGKEAFIREEMLRLGFWPPSDGVAAKSKDAEVQLRALYDELGNARSELSGVETQISESGDIPKLLAEVRKRRIERSRAARAEKRVQRAQEQVGKQAQDREWRKKRCRSWAMASRRV